jgi:hypothetical protein
VAQVLVPLQRLDRRTPRRRLVIDDFGVAPGARSGGIAYITVTDAAGRVLFRRPATQQEVTDALRSADEADREGEAVMERISYDRMFQELIGDSE